MSHLNSVTLLDARRVLWRFGSCSCSVLELYFHKDCWRLGLNAGHCVKQTVWQASCCCSVSITLTLLSAQHQLQKCWCCHSGWRCSTRQQGTLTTALTQSELQGASAGESARCWVAREMLSGRVSEVQCWSEGDGHRLRQTGHGEVGLKPFTTQRSLYAPPV